jgi:beta-barrel assembly-enhancing protease
MKKLFIVLVLLMLIINLIQAQMRLSVIAKATDKINLSSLTDLSNKKLNSGEEIMFLSVGLDPNTISSISYIVAYDGNQYQLPERFLDNLDFSNQSSISEAWNAFLITSDFYKNIFERGYQYDLRQDLEYESLDFINGLIENNYIYREPYLEDYLQSILLKVHSCHLSDNRPGNLNILIVKNEIPNAYSLPNGTIILTTGVLSVINSEEELAGILIHEIAHFVLDHQIININLQQARQKRAEFWAGFATVLAAASEAYIATKYDVYTGGALTLSTSAISYSIAEQVIERMGNVYTQEQEKKADEAAYQLLQFLNISPDAYASALFKIGVQLTKTGNYYTLSNSSSHPALYTRIKGDKYKDENLFYSDDYHKKISLLASFNAALEYNSNHFLAAEKIIDRNIHNGVATEEDYILKAKLIRSQFNSTEKNKEALQYLEIAEGLNIVPVNSLYKEKGIVLLRLNRNEDAVLAFKNYLELLQSGQENLDQIKSSKYWDYWAEHISIEKDWTKTMIFKAGKM